MTQILQRNLILRSIYRRPLGVPGNDVSMTVHLTGGEVSYFSLRQHPAPKVELRQVPNEGSCVAAQVTVITERQLRGVSCWCPDQRV